MGLRQRIAPTFAGQVELPGEAGAFLEDLVAEGFSPVGFTGPRARYQARPQDRGVVVEAQDALTAWNIGLERVALLPGPATTGGFTLLYLVELPRWARFCWTISLCTTVIPVGILTAVVLLAAGLYPPARDFAQKTVLNALYPVIVAPIVVFGLAFPLLLVAMHKPQARKVLERVLRDRAERVARRATPDRA